MATLEWPSEYTVDDDIVRLYVKASYSTDESCAEEDDPCTRGDDKAAEDLSVKLAAIRTDFTDQAGNPIHADTTAVRVEVRFTCSGSLGGQACGLERSFCRVSLLPQILLDSQFVEIESR